jgi:hypothetical protein
MSCLPLRSIPPAVALGLALAAVHSASAQSTAAPAPLPGAAAPAGPPACQTPEHRQFDFWLGHWTVRAPNGRVAGTNHIESSLDGCALVERWAGSGPSRGMSLNYYDAATRQWHQTWTDNSGQPLLLNGGLRDGRMVLEGTAPGPDGRPARQRVTWTPLAGGDVRQHWEVSSDSGATWSTVFDGRYSRRPAP